MGAREGPAFVCLFGLGEKSTKGACGAPRESATVAPEGHPSEVAATYQIECPLWAVAHTSAVQPGKWAPNPQACLQHLCHLRVL